MEMVEGLSKIPYVQAAIVVVVALVAAKITGLFIGRVLSRLAKKTRIEADDMILAIVQKPVCNTIVFQGFREAIPYLGFSERLSRYGDAFFATAIIIFWMIGGIRLSSLFLDRSMVRIADITGIGGEIIPLAKTLTKIVIIVTGFILILSAWRIDITPFLASAGIVGVAVALAAKETLSNFFGGVSIFVDKPYKLGDYIILESGERGEVVEIGVRSTRVKTRDDVVITIPNSIMAHSKIVNESVPVERYRVRIAVGVAYGSDVNKVEEILTQEAVKNAEVVADPAPRARFRAFGASALEFELQCWIRDPANKGLVTHQLNKNIYNTFAEQGVTIPFPQRDVHLYQKQ